MTTNHQTPYPPDRSHQTAPYANDDRWQAPVKRPRSSWAKRQARQQQQAESSDKRRTRRLPLNQLVG